MIIRKVPSSLNSTVDIGVSIYGITRLRRWHCSMIGLQTAGRKWHLLMNHSLAMTKIFNFTTGCNSIHHMLSERPESLCDSKTIVKQSTSLQLNHSHIQHVSSKTPLRSTFLSELTKIYYTVDLNILILHLQLQKLLDWMFFFNFHFVSHQQYFPNKNFSIFNFYGSI